jgi:hypothetical protein
LTSLADQEGAKEGHAVELDICNVYKDKIATELESVCNDVLGLLTDKLIPNAEEVRERGRDTDRHTRTHTHTHTTDRERQTESEREKARDESPRLSIVVYAVKHVYDSAVAWRAH